VGSVPEPEDPVQSVLAALAASAKQANLARAAVIAEALEQIAAGGAGEEHRLAAAQAAHQVVGSAGTFGSRHASALAASLERFLAAPDAVDLPAAALSRARDELEQLRHELEASHQVEE
jgi:HPt (histidine-containing phosphotransfer) domain-containing protein